jgi:hypothetical protein
LIDEVLATMVRIEKIPADCLFLSSSNPEEDSDVEIVAKASAPAKDHEIVDKNAALAKKILSDGGSKLSLREKNSSHF